MNWNNFFRKLSFRIIDAMLAIAGAVISLIMVGGGAFGLWKLRDMCESAVQWGALGVLAAIYILMVLGVICAWGDIITDRRKEGY